MAKNKSAHQDDTFSVSEDDDCAICRATRAAKERGKDLSYQELQAAFREANKESGDGVFVFDTKVLGYKREVARTIAVPTSWNLYKLAEAIVTAYDFNFDHAFGFFDVTSSDDYTASIRKYELFTDIIEEGEDIEPTGAGSVKHTRLDQVWSKRGDSMLFLFDYGDDWHFSVTLTATGNGIASSATPLPLILAATGKSPKQYE